MSEKNNSGSGFWWFLAAAAAVIYIFVWPAIQRSNIERVLIEDHNASVAAVKDAGVTDVLWDQSRVTGKVVDGMRNINLSGCPDEFRQAYEKHIQAWENQLRVTKRYGGFTGAVKGLVTMGGATYSAWSEATETNQEIKDTYKRVLQIAKQYGVELKK